MCLAALLCEQFCRFANGGAKISIKSYFMRSFFVSVFSSSEVLGKNASIRRKLLTAACWCREENRGNCDANLLYVKSDLGSTDQSFTVFFARWGVKFDRWVKCLPVVLNNSTIELHVPSRRKKSLQSYFSMDFDFLALMRFDMTFDVTFCGGTHKFM